MKRLIVCGQKQFDAIMKERGYSEYCENIPDNLCLISICADGEGTEHYFKKEAKNVLNVDVEDVFAFWWEEKKQESKVHKIITIKELMEHEISVEDILKIGEKTEERYNQLYNLWKDSINVDNEFVCDGIKIMNFDEAKRIVDFIRKNIEKADEIIIHCYAGISRSAAVAKYILDRYQEFEWDVPYKNWAPNKHIYKMLTMLGNETQEKHIYETGTFLHRNGL